MKPTKRCPICTRVANELLTVKTYPIQRCADCSHQFVSVELPTNHVDNQFADDYFSGGGTSGYQNYLLSRNLVEQHGARYASIVERHCQSNQRHERKRLLDIGSAAGFIMKGFEGSGWSATGLEPNRAMVDYANSKGLATVQGTLESIDLQHTRFTAAGRFDLVCLIQVVAHLSDLKRSMKSIDSLVSNTGHVLVETWNSASASARILGARWHEYSPPNVLHFFTKASLDQLFELSGFSPVAGGRPVKKISIEHARSLIRYKYGDSKVGRTMLSASAALPNHLAIPYPSEDLFWRLYKRQA